MGEKEVTSSLERAVADGCGVVRLVRAVRARSKAMVLVPRSMRSGTWEVARVVRRLAGSVPTGMAIRKWERRFSRIVAWMGG